MRTCFLIILFLVTAVVAQAHVGSPNVFFEGKAGDYPLRVVIRPPQVVPGLAEITVRAQADAIQRITVLPVFWKAGRKGAPPADVAKLVRGETNLYTAALWLMKAGSYSVEVTVEGPRGPGTLIIPVNSVATNTRPMSPAYSLMLCTLGLLLLIGALQIAYAAFGQSVVEPGAFPTNKDHWRGRIATLVTAVILGALLLGGKKWWDYEDRVYRVSSLYQPTPLSAVVKTDHGQHILQIKIDGTDERREWTPLLPDHGKMMHLFLVRDGQPGAFAHLHPITRNNQLLFETPLPPLPAARYHIYADITHETGFAETLTTTSDIPAASLTMTKLWLGNLAEPICSPLVMQRLSTNLFFPPDPDDSWQMDSVLPSATTSDNTTPRIAEISGGYKLIWENPQPLAPDQDVSLRFRLSGPDNRAPLIEPYMGMLGHAVVRREDGSVFAHVHPAGTFSMAAQEFFSKPTSRASAATSGSDVAVHTSHTNGVAETVSFPYAFPKPGPYRLWVQTKSEGKILTAVFNLTVAEPR